MFQRHICVVVQLIKLRRRHCKDVDGCYSARSGNCHRAGAFPGGIQYAATGGSLVLNQLRAARHISSESQIARTIADHVVNPVRRSGQNRRNRSTAK